MRVAAGLLVWAAVAVAPPAAWAVSDLAGRQSEAERQQAALRDRIDALQKEIDTREAARKEAADALKESESAISRINLRLRELGEASRKAEAELAGLEKQVVAQQAVLQKRRAELADQLRTQYTSGLSPWTALLSGDDPQQLGRNLGYLDYVSRARAQAVHALREDIARLAALQGQADARRDDIQTLVAETSSQKAALVEQQKTRATLLAKLEGQIAAQRAEAGKLGRDDQRLSHLIDDLGSAIARQAEEDARRRAAEEARRKEEEARQAEAARRAEAARQQEAARQAAAAREADARRQAETARQAQQARDAEARDAAAVREQAEAAARQGRGPVALADPDAAGLRQVEGGRLVDPQAAPPRETRPAARAEPAEPAPREAAPARTASAAPVGGGNGLRRGLPMPVRGTIQGRFGVDRPDGGVWRGLVLRTAEGTPVKVVAPGTVVYAEWLRGFGNLIIVDHGQQYLTVYAYNQSLLKRVGDRVAAGDTIATVGATGGQVESGLYFEIRHRGAPVDPAQWLAQ
ncbi:murein hydrolase activator EnvC family protein [Bordetella bronchiseptica]|uniref:murein hydrolase activator EnvC family protein n=4 Tax=Bordetella bronchiseptica TaxID=518 RepID=UPI00028B20AA|nr:peptidoglycan DD-metalloendopeptidase family protein [Bordetella bronchiseptica]KDC22197.1 peptidase, M23 family [Bordetella bronchiseptica F-1]KDD43976.1 peptidase, M23 family [Bordetella bronchiseptica OSU095]QET69500.1 peptidoglycan DD-metalloendopeptidase family protein [Bordetella bronchiseptica]CCJ57040.1 putative peptidase [Bordetella bronchiseptica MO149]